MITIISILITLLPLAFIIRVRRKIKATVKDSQDELKKKLMEQEQITELLIRLNAQMEPQAGETFDIAVDPNHTGNEDFEQEADAISVEIDGLSDDDFCTLTETEVEGMTVFVAGKPTKRPPGCSHG